MTELHYIDVESQDPDALEAANRDNLHRILTEDAGRLEHLSRVLSTRSDARVSTDSTEAEEDFKLESVLRKHVDQSERDGIFDRSVGVVFKDLTVKGVDMGAKSLPTVGELLMTPFRIPETIRKARNVKYRNLIQDFDGVMKKGEMLLVLGRPGAGSSTFLRTIAGEIDAFVEIMGEINYDGVDQHTMKTRFKGDLLYSPETDVHFPILNVDQTLSFAADIKAPRVRAGNVSRDQYVKDMRDVLATVFGLKHTYNTRVGSDYIRGVSGGERKRVSLAEVMAGRANLVCWDNSTRGLDASTALEYAKTLRTITNLLKNTAIVAIYQAGQNIYELFDKVTVIYLGRQIYFGPIEDAKAYFEEMGYACQFRQTTAEFLTALTDPAGRFVKPGFEDRVPTTPDEFVDYWKKSPQYKALLQDIDEYQTSCDKDAALKYMVQSVKQERPLHGKRPHSPYTLSFFMQLKILIRRGFQRQAGDRSYMGASLLSAVAQSLVVGSLFYNISDTYNGAFSRGGVLFFALLFFTLNSMAEMAMLYPQRHIIEKQKRFAFYHPAAEALSFMITALPLKIVSMTIFNIILFFLSNMKRTAGQFFLFMLFINCTTFCMTCFFQMVSAFAKTLEIANAIAGLGLMVVFIYAGFLIPRPLMHVWFKWLSWLNPIRYGFEALVTNEFHGRDMDCTANLIPSGAKYDDVSLAYRVCASTGSKTAQDYVYGDDYVQEAFAFKFSTLWRNFGVLIAYFVFFLVCYCIASEMLSPGGINGDVLVFQRGHVPEEADTKNEKDEKALTSESDENSDDLADNGALVKMSEIFSWQHVNYNVILPNGEDRRLLCDVQGYTKPGTLTALMGESGAGKTTLLNVLAQRINVGVITGDMFVDGKTLGADFKRRTGYVQQQDLHVSEATVRESLRFSAVLRQPRTVSLAEKYEHVERVIDMLDMRSYSEAVVGILGQGLNVEQRKKLSIGVELAAKPSLLLFLDEPTSGLDSQSAWAIVQLLRKLANAGQSILCTIHQPSATLFEQFDKLLLLKKGGKTVYFGDIGKTSASVINYFESHGAQKCGDDENPAEYILNCIGAGATVSASSDWYDIWTGSENYSNLTQEINGLHAELAKLPPKVVSKELSGTFAASYFTQLIAVTKRTFDQFWRDPEYIKAKLILSISSGLFTGFSFWKSDFSLMGVQNLLFGVFLAIIIGVPMMNQIQPRFIVSRELYEVRESASNTYHWSILLLSSLIVEIPYNVVCATLFYLCYYWPIGYNRTAEIAGYFYFIFCICYTLYYTSLSLAIASIAQDAATANVITSLLVSFILSFAGIFQVPSQIPHFWKFMYRISPLTYFLQCLLSAVLHDGKVTCKPDEFNIFQPVPGQTCWEYASEFIESNGGYLNNANATESCQYCKWTVADQFLETVGINYSTDRWRDVGFIFAFIIFNVCVTFIGYYGFRIMNWEKINIVKKMKKRITG